VALGITAEEWVVLMSAVAPLVLAIAVVWVFWRWAKRDEARERAERDAQPPA
jgi:type VI protein secretion system component VasK